MGKGLRDQVLASGGAGKEQPGPGEYMLKGVSDLGPPSDRGRGGRRVRRGLPFELYREQRTDALGP